MSIVVSDLSERLDTLTKLVLAEPVARIGHSRVTVRPLTLRGKAFFQLEYQQGQKVAHRNASRAARCSKRSNRSLTVCSAPSRSAPKRRRASTSARRTARTSAPPSPARPAPP